MASKCRTWICALLFILSFMAAASDAVCAQEKQAVLITLDQEQDLVVNFAFDKEIVDIIFISPSGELLGPDSSRVETAFGELWASYRVLDAESGEWSVQYDLKGNSSIQYSVIEEDYGIWIQYLNLSKVSDDSITVSFEADCEKKKLNYGYEIYAVCIPNDGSMQLLTSGQAVSGEEHSEDISLLDLSSGDYILSLEISCLDGNAELFDSMRSDKFSFANPQEPESIEDYEVYLDAGNHTCHVVWEEYASYYDAYKLVVYGDGKEPIYNGTLEEGIWETGFTFPNDSTKLSLALSGQMDGVWSAPLEKEIVFKDGEYLRLGTKEITGDSQFLLEYDAKKERMLSISVNEGEASEYRLMDQGQMAFPLESGSNTIYAQFESDQRIFYVVDTEIYFDAEPPEIILYENLDGKTFHDSSVDVIGKISGGNVLLANGENVELDEFGEFSLACELSPGENVFSLEATDVNGNSSVQALTLYQASVAAETGRTAGGWRQLWPLAAALSASVSIFILELLFMKKKDRQAESAGQGSMIGWLLAAVALLAADVFCIYEFIKHWVTAGSMEFIRMAERSVFEASKYLKMRNLFGIAAGGGAVLWVLLILLMAFRMKRQKGRKS